MKHTIIIQVDCEPDGTDLDALLNLIQSHPGVVHALDREIIEPTPAHVQTVSIAVSEIHEED